MALGLTVKGVNTAYKTFSKLLANKSDTDKVKYFLDHVTDIRAKNNLQGGQTKLPGYKSPLYDNPKTIALARIANDDVAFYGDEMATALGFKNATALSGKIHQLDRDIKKRGYLSFVQGNKTNKRGLAQKEKGRTLPSTVVATNNNMTDIYAAMSQPGYSAMLGEKLASLGFTSPKVSLKDAATILEIPENKLKNILRGSQRKNNNVVSIKYDKRASGNKQSFYVDLQGLVNEAKQITTRQAVTGNRTNSLNDISKKFRDKWVSAFKRDFPADALEARRFRDSIVTGNGSLKGPGTNAADHILSVRKGLTDLDMGWPNFQLYYTTRMGGRPMSTMRGKEADAMIDDFILQQRATNPNYFNLSSVMGKENLQKLTYEMNTPGVVRGSKGTYFDDQFNNVFKDDAFLKSISDEAEDIKSFLLRDAKTGALQRGRDGELLPDTFMFTSQNLKALQKTTAGSSQSKYGGFNTRLFKNKNDLDNPAFLKEFIDKAEKRLKVIDDMILNRNEKVVSAYDEMAALREVEGFKTPNLPGGIKNILNDAGRDAFVSGGRVKKSIGGITTNVETPQFDFTGKKGDNEVSWITSVLSGIGSGIIDIPRGAFSLGASLIDLGLGTNNAAKVEKFFNDLDPFDEMAEQTLTGQMVRIITNLGVPGAAAFKLGSSAATAAVTSARAGNYFRATEKLAGETTKALNAKGRVATTLGGVGGVATADMIFVGDPERVGTLGDLFGGPTAIKPNDENDAAREVMNRVKFGTESALFLGALGASGSALKSAIKRKNELGSHNEKLDLFLSKFRPRGDTPEEFFEAGRRSIGTRGSDINIASEISRSVDKEIDAIFPNIRTTLDGLKGDGAKGLAKARQNAYERLNDMLLSGTPLYRTEKVLGKDGIESGFRNVLEFDELTVANPKVKETIEFLKKNGASKENINNILAGFNRIRGRWGDMFSGLGKTMSPKDFEEFGRLFGSKFKGYMGSTYEIFTNKSLTPFMGYKPTEQSVKKVMSMFMEASKDAKGVPSITTEQARFYVDKLIESARQPKGLPTASDKVTGVLFEANDKFAKAFLKGSVMDDIIKNDRLKDTMFMGLDSMKDAARANLDELFGKTANPMQTILAGSNKLSFITRRNELFRNLTNIDADIKAKVAAAKKMQLDAVANPALKASPEYAQAMRDLTNPGLFAQTSDEATMLFGNRADLRPINMDPNKTLMVEGITNPLEGLYTTKGIKKSLEEGVQEVTKSTMKQMYDNFILYPKATSQIAKTILSPITHVRNFVSAGAFAAANGIVPGVTVGPQEMKAAFNALQIPGQRINNERYRELLELGVVNSNVAVGDLTRLLKDVQFGDTVTSDRALRSFFKPLSKIKSVTQDFYTAEDDFWKMTVFAGERNRINNAYKAIGIIKNDRQLDEMAAEIVRNNVPNYDMVPEFIKGLRQLPIGNFVSFPAEILRTSGNILKRSYDEIFNMKETLPDGRVIAPFKNIGLKRLAGFATTTMAVPYGTVEAAKAIYDVSSEEMEALRRFVPDWSKNSTLVPIRDDETGDLKYIDFSHANAYDTIIRPITTMYNAVGRGMDDETSMGREVLTGMMESAAELVNPFISEAIFTEAATDIIIRNGRTQSGSRLYTDQTPWGDKAAIITKHILNTQLPGSLDQLVRLNLAAKKDLGVGFGDKDALFDEYGREYNIADEGLGLLGMRAVKVDPITAMKFKIADFRVGVNNSRREFTQPLLKGGAVTPEQIVDRYRVANESLYKVHNEMFKDYYGAKILGVNSNLLNSQFTDRMSREQLQAIAGGKFKPLNISENIKDAFRENARAIGATNPYVAADATIRNMFNRYSKIPLNIKEGLPFMQNPFVAPEPQGLPDTVIGGQISNVNLANQPLQVSGINNNINSTTNTLAKGQALFGANDKIFGS